MPYRAACDLQRALVSQRRAGAIPDLLVLLEHPPTFTLGRSSTAASLLFDEQMRRTAGIDLIESDRGGGATYHGPGQIVGYPIVDLRPRGRDLHRYLRDVEEVLLRALSDLGVVGRRDSLYTGVWMGNQKLAAIGVKVSGGITSHGFALNIDPDFAHWDGIVPCGIEGRGVTSLARVLGKAPRATEVRSLLARHASDVFGLDWRAPRPGELPEWPIRASA